MRNTHQWTGHTKSRSIAQDIPHWNTNNCVFSHLSTESFIFSSCCSNLSPQALTIYKNWMIAMPVEMELHTHLWHQGIYFVYLTLSPCQVIRFQMYTTCWKDTKAHCTQVIIIKMFWFLQYFIQKIWMKYFSCPKWQLTQCLIDRVLPCTGQMKDSAGLPHGWTHNFLWQVLKSVDPSTMLPKGVLTAILSCLQLFNS